MAICTSVHWAFNLMLAKSTPYMIENLGGYGIYFVFASCVSFSSILRGSVPVLPTRPPPTLSGAFRAAGDRPPTSRKSSQVHEHC